MTKKKPFADLRAFIDFLRQEDRLKSISAADWNLELGGLTELVWRKKGEDCPALLFDNIKGYPSGYRVMTLGVASTYHYMAAMNLQPTADRRTAVRALKELVAPEAVTPREVSTGPILENNITGADLDVTMFPAPKFKEDEGGRYIGTGNLVFTRDATTGELNMGTYRVQVHGPDKVTVSVAPGHHGGVHIDSYLSQGQPAPILISLGQAPDLFLSSIEEFPYGVNELEMVGGRRGEPVEIIKGETTGLPMPASAEIVLEGHMYPDAEAGRIRRSLWRVLRLLRGPVYRCAADHRGAHLSSQRPDYFRAASPPPAPGRHPRIQDCPAVVERVGALGHSRGSMKSIRCRSAPAPSTSCR